LPTVTVTVAPSATLWHKARSAVIVTVAAIIRDKDVFIASKFRRKDSDGLPLHATLKK
jgi:hypothetical protein